MMDLHGCYFPELYYRSERWGNCSRCSQNSMHYAECGTRLQCANCGHTYHDNFNYDFDFNLFPKKTIKKLSSWLAKKFKSPLSRKVSKSNLEVEKDLKLVTQGAQS